MTRLTIDSSGRVSLPATLAKGLGGGHLDLVSHSPHHLLLAPQSGSGGVLLAGRLGVLAVADLLSFFNMFRKSGVLHFSLAGGSKELTFQQGEVVGVVSTFPEEEFGAILLALGKLDRATLQQVRQSAAGRAGLGKALVDAGQLTAKDLWLATRAQAETIIYQLFTQHEGSFSFCERTAGETAPTITLSTPNLIMEGLRRIDERTLFARHIPSLDVVPVVIGVASAELPPAEERLLAQIRRGRQPVRELLRVSGLGEFDGLRLLHHLAERQLLAFDAVPRVEVSGECGEILEIFNGVLVHIQRQILQVNPAFGVELRHFVRELPQPFSFVLTEAVLCDDGGVDGGRILASLASLGEVDRKRLLADALHELLLMACVAARRDLGVGASAELVQRVQEIGRRVKTMTGRDL